MCSIFLHTSIDKRSKQLFRGLGNLFREIRMARFYSKHGCNFSSALSEIDAGVTQLLKDAITEQSVCRYNRFLIRLFVASCSRSERTSQIGDRNVFARRGRPALFEYINFRDRKADHRLEFQTADVSQKL